MAELKEQVLLDIAKTSGIIVDLGCGFKPKVGQRSVPNSIGLDLNFQHGKVMADNPVISDVQVLPIRDEVADFVNASAILEHLPRAGDAMNEMRRIMRPASNGFILIPVDSRQIPQSLRRFVKEWPFSLRRILHQLYNSATLWKIPGMPHITQIDLSDIRNFFTIDNLRIRRYEHAWFKHGPLKILRKLGLVKRTVYIKEFAEWYIWIGKK